MKIIGITGGIGSGKSTISNYLTKKGFKIIDADKIAKNLLDIGEEAYFKAVEYFGTEILNPDKTVDRKKLGSIIFASREKRKILNEITHDLVKKRVLSEIAANEATQKVIFLDVPLMFEVGMDELCEEVWLVVADERVKILRLQKRDEITKDEIIAKFRSQMPDEEKIKRADFVIDNSGNEEALYLQLDKLLKKYEKKDRN